MRCIAPGVYDDGDGLHIDLVVLLEANGWEDNPTNRAALETAARDLFGDRLIVTTEPIEEDLEP